MSRITRSSLGLVAVSALVSGALIAPTAAPAKTVKFKVVTKKISLGAGGKFKTTGTGTFGKATVTGSAVPPNIVFKLKVKGGTITAKSTNAKGITGGVGGSLKLTGTGKYKKLKGSGKFSLKLGSFVCTMTGTAKY